jgi:hypothetical protein
MQEGTGSVGGAVVQSSMLSTISALCGEGKF